MDDVRFMIVNSNLRHSKALKSELDSRVSFDVYQDTEEKNIWGLMQGGKDDVYVYDRCGRLAYYIPFPLSIMTEEDSLVRTAIIATYFLNPCNDTCDHSGISSLDRFRNFNSTDAPETTTDSNVEFETMSYQEFVPSNTTEELLRNETTSPIYNDILKIAGNDSDLYSAEDFDYEISNETASDINVTHTRPHEHNDLHNMYHSNVTFDELVDSNTTSTTNETFPTTNPRNISNDNPMIMHAHHSHSESNDTDIRHLNSKTQNQKKFDRCAEADLSVCKNWSKRKLLRAQTCCSADQTSPALSEFCRNYGKKRCKKIRTVLKCCIKTEYVETTTTTTTTTESTTVAETTTVEDVAEVVTCCIDDIVGRTCRVSATGSCENGEFVLEKVEPESSPQNEDTN